MRKLPAVAVLLMSTMAIAGCGSSKPTGKLSGKIFFEKQPVLVGSLTVVSTDGNQSAAGRVNPDGTYVCEKAPAGPVKISFNYQAVVDPMGKVQGDKDNVMSKMRDMLKDKGGDKSLVSGPELTDEQKKCVQALATLPEKYRSWQISGLQTEVTANQDNNYDIVMIKAK